MRTELNNTARKQYRRLNEPHRGRIVEALDLLEKQPPEGNIKKLQGRDGYRVVVGDYHILFETNLTAEEKAVIKAGRKERKEHPENFTPWATVKAED